MLFNTIDFAIFLPVVFLIYWFVTSKNIRLQNILIVVASYIFYAWWDWRFLALIIFSTSVDYFIGLFLNKSIHPKHRKTLMLTSVFINIGLLGFFKYFNFFVDNFIAAFTILGYSIQENTLQIILPVGISFYTFQTMSYTIDVYRKKMKPTKDIFAFAAFVSFFPQLVAGPIERATNLLPQFYKKRKFNESKAVDGLRQTLWGVFKKVVIADNCAIIANHIFDNSSELNGSTLVLGSVFFAFQIYGDFSGYSDIAIGISRLFGFDLKQNFAFPYFSRDIAEFWRRWHISLSTWFRDYVYIPLGGSRSSNIKKVRNILIVFAISGFWHGANWTFLVWGLLNALFFLPLLLTGNNRNHLDNIAHNQVLPSFKTIVSIIGTFAITCFAWIFFRANTIEHAFNYVIGIFSKSLFEMPKFSNQNEALLTILFVVFCMVIEWMSRQHLHALEKFGFGWPKILRRGFYFTLGFLILLFIGSKQEFIYFQF